MLSSSLPLSLLSSLEDEEDTGCGVFFGVSFSSTSILSAEFFLESLSVDFFLPFLGLTMLTDSFPILSIGRQQDGTLGFVVVHHTSLFGLRSVGFDFLARKITRKKLGGSVGTSFLGTKKNGG